MYLNEFYQACNKGDIAKVKQMISEGINFNLPVCANRIEADGLTLLHYACNGSSVEIIQLL